MNQRGFLYVIRGGRADEKGSRCSCELCRDRGELRFFDPRRRCVVETICPHDRAVIDLYCNETGYRWITRPRGGDAA